MEIRGTPGRDRFSFSLEQTLYGRRAGDPCRQPAREKRCTMDRKETHTRKTKESKQLRIDASFGRR